MRIYFQFFFLSVFGDGENKKIKKERKGNQSNNLSGGQGEIMSMILVSLILLLQKKKKIK